MSRINGKRFWMPIWTMWFYRRFLYCLQIYGNTARVCRVIEKQTFLYLVIIKNARKTPRNAEIGNRRESRLFRWLKLNLHFSSAKFPCMIRSSIERKCYEKNNMTKKYYVYQSLHMCIFMFIVHILYYLYICGILIDFLRYCKSEPQFASIKMHSCQWMEYKLILIIALLLK